MLKTSLFDYIVTYIHAEGTITISNTGTAATPNNRGKKFIFKNCGPFIESINEINNTQIDNAEGLDVVMLMYNLIEHSDIYLKNIGRLQQYYRDETALNNGNDFIDFPANSNNGNNSENTTNNSILSKFKEKKAKKTTMVQNMLK